MKKTDTAEFLSEGKETRTQYGALCWRMHRGCVQVLLITSRDTGRWVIPKGWPMAGHSAESAAAREAWEEAGVQGTLDPGCIGVFSYEKGLGPNQSVPCVVAVYALRVARLSHRFPERKVRQRKWFDVEKAARRVAEPELRALILGFPGDPAAARDSTRPPRITG